MNFPNILTPSGAVFSAGEEACALYRHILWRHWGNGSRLLHICGLNPSTAGHTVDDPTIRREISFAKRWGFDGLLKTNAFDYRSTDPDRMLTHLAPCSPDNNWWILECHKRADKSVAAWGVHGIHNNRAYDLKRMIQWECLGLTKDGHPKHPLYVKSDTPLIHFNLIAVSEAYLA